MITTTTDNRKCQDGRQDGYLLPCPVDNRCQNGLASLIRRGWQPHICHQNFNAVYRSSRYSSRPTCGSAIGSDIAASIISHWDIYLGKVHL